MNGLKILSETRWQYTYEDNVGFHIWKYDSKKNGNNPIEVEVKFKSKEDVSGRKVKFTKIKK